MNVTWRPELHGRRGRSRSYRTLLVQDLRHLPHFIEFNLKQRVATLPSQCFINCFRSGTIAIKNTLISREQLRI